MRKATLRKSEIIRLKKEILKIKKNGLIVRNEFLEIRYLPNGNRKILVTCSADIKKATDRNLLKRRLREIYRLHKKSFLDKHHYLIYARNPALTLTFDQLKSNLLSLISAIKSKNE